MKGKRIEWRIKISPRDTALSRTSAWTAGFYYINSLKGKPYLIENLL